MNETQVLWVWKQDVGTAGSRKLMAPPGPLPWAARWLLSQTPHDSGVTPAPDPPKKPGV